MANDILTLTAIQSTELSIESIGDELVVDSRLIAMQLGIEHRALFRTIDKYISELQHFGHLRFENATVTNSVGATNTVKFVYLNENQSALLMTISRNTKQVIECKINLVTAFSNAKSIINVVIPAQNQKLVEMQMELDILRMRTNLADRQDSMLQLHGKQVVLALAGCSDAIVREEVKVTEVINLSTGSTEVFLSAEQLKNEVMKRTGQKVKSQKQFIDELRKLGRDDLLVAVTRPVTAQYVKPVHLDEAIAIVYSSGQQTLLGQ